MGIYLLVMRVDFEDLLGQMSELDHEKWMSSKEITYLLCLAMERRELRLVYDSVNERINQETEYFKIYEELGLLDVILAGFEGVEEVTEEVQWQCWGMRAGGDYNPSTGIIRIAGYRQPDSSSQASVIYSLADDGTLGRPLTVLAHEKLHELQYSTLTFFEWIWDGWRFREPTELMEVQARMAESGKENSLSKIKLIGRISQARDTAGVLFYPRVNIDRLIYAVTVVDQMVALGLSVVEIGRMVMLCGMWARNKGIYPKIQKFIDKEMVSQGLTVDDLDNLVLAKNLQREVDRLKARKIVQEELQGRFSNDELTEMWSLLGIA